MEQPGASSATIDFHPHEHTPNISEHMQYDEEFPSLGPGGQSSGPTSGLSSPGATTKWSQKMRIGSNIVTSVFHIPFEERSDRGHGDRFGDMDAHKECAEITMKCGAHIEMSSSSRDQSLTFLVTGKNASVLEARRIILARFQTQAESKISIPKEHHRFILGKQGSKLSELEKLTSTKISVPRPNEDSNLVIIQGTREGIEKAVHELGLISDEQSKQASERITIPKKYHPFINGPHNEKSNALSSQNNVRINVPPYSVMNDDLIIVGEKEGVALVAQTIKREYEEWKRYATVSVEVGKSQHKYIIGPKRNTIHEILERTGVSVEMPSTESPSETITLRGPTDKIGNALTLLYEKANSVTTRIIEAPNWIHKHVIGKKGANIKNITMHYSKVHVEIRDNQIIIEGPPEEAEPITEQLRVCVTDFLNNLSYQDLQVDPRHHKHIIGKMGANVNRLKDETGVIISVKDGDSAIIHLEGPRQGVELAVQRLNEQISKLESEKEKDLIIDHRFHGNIIGAKGEKIREIRDQFNQVQIAFPQPGEKRDVVQIRGPKEDVDRCGRHLMQIVKELHENSYQIKVPVFPQCYRLVIGKGGQNIKKIKEETKTRFELPPLEEGKSKTEAEIIVITGKKENCEAARDKLLNIQNSVANVVEIDVMIPNKFHNSLIGSGGKLVQSISEECGGVQIKFPDHKLKSDRVALIGIKDDCEKAKNTLLEMSREKETNSYTETLEAKSHHHKFLIGKNGSNIRKIRESTGARIFFPNEGDPNPDTITLIGKKESVANAKNQLNEMLKDLKNIVESEMDIDPAFHRHFVLRRGEILRQISDDLGGVQISFPKPNSNSTRVTLKGAQECVDAAKERLSKIVVDLSKRINIEVMIEQKHHRTIMGTRGSKVQQIQFDYNVDIKFPERNDDQNAYANGDGIRHSDIIRVSGLPEDCEAAKQALLDQVPVRVEVDIPFEMHRFIIGMKGKDVREMMGTYDVSITVPQADQHSDTIIIMGSPKNAAAAKDALVRKRGDLEEEKKMKELKSFSVQIQVDPEFHPKIIGRKGTVIDKIRRAHDVNIQLPKKGEKDEDIIIITGFEDKVKAAKDEIMAIVNQLTDMVKEEVEIDHRVHSRIIGAKGKSVRQIMNDYQVDIRFPRSNDPNPNLVVISSSDMDKILDAKDHLLNLEEEFLQDVTDSEYLSQFVRDSNQNTGSTKNKAQSNGFVVKGAPWEQPPDTQSNEEFPSVGNGTTEVVTEQAAARPLNSAWGARKHF